MSGNCDLQPGGKKLYCAENLRYTMPALIVAMLIVLMGFFSYSLAMAFIPNILPLKLKLLGADNKTIVLIMTTLGQVFNITICPMVSFQSDRYRSKRWGRRVPFILSTMPMLCLSWVLFAFVDKESAWAVDAVAPWFTVAPTTMTVLLIGVIMLIHQFFLMYVGSVIYYIYNDVIPAEFLSRFVGLVQVVSTLGGVLFNFFIFEHGVEYFEPLLLGNTAVYILGVGGMCLLLKEPRFPEPTALEQKQSKGMAGIRTFVTESFSHPFYWYSFLGVSATAVSGVGTFMVFFHQDMGLNLSDIGKMGGISGLVSTGVAMLVAAFGTILIDRWHPVRVNVFTIYFGVLQPLLFCKWIFFTPPRNIYWVAMLFVGIFVGFLVQFRGISGMPMLMRTYPKTRFGQFCSAQSMLRSGTVLVLSLGLGAYIDILKYNFRMGDFAFRYIWVWMLFWSVLSAFFYVKMYIAWLRLGGYDGYKAPASWLESGYEPMPVTPTVGPDDHRLRLVLLLLDAVMVLSAGGAAWLGWYFRADVVLSRAFLTTALPASGGVLLLWLVVRWRIVRDLNRVARNLTPKNGIPHHGILLLLGVTLLPLLGCCFYQSYAVGCVSTGVVTAASMWVYEAVVMAVMVVMIHIYTRIERVGLKKDEIGITTDCTAN